MQPSISERMKTFEAAEAKRRTMPLLPVLVRLDGKNFSHWTRGLQRPFDERMSQVMIEVTRRLVEAANACIGNTQSDEISLVLYSPTHESQIYCDGRIQKLASILSSMCTAWFNELINERIPEKRGRLAFFDARVWSVPTQAEAVNVLVWREQDATRNAVLMAAAAHFSHRQMHGKKTDELRAMMREQGTQFESYPVLFKRGTYVQRKIVRRKFNDEELQKLPPKHEAHTNPDLVVERSQVEQVDMPPITEVPNRVEVVFAGAKPEQLVR